MATATATRTGAERRTSKAGRYLVVEMSPRNDGSILTDMLIQGSAGKVEEELLRWSFGFVLGEDMPEPDEAGAFLMERSAVVWDREAGRPSRVCTFRRPVGGESRLPIFKAVDVETASVREVSIEHYEAGR